MLYLLAVLNPVQVVEGCGLRVEKALAYDKDEVPFPQNLVDLGVLEDKPWFGKYAGLGLKARFIVFAIAVVLVEAIRRPVLRNLVMLAAEHDVIEVTFHE
jgi:hypothetical protein